MPTFATKITILREILFEGIPWCNGNDRFIALTQNPTNHVLNYNKNKTIHCFTEGPQRN
jgi:hypothetical protein